MPSHLLEPSGQRPRGGPSAYLGSISGSRHRELPEAAVNSDKSLPGSITSGMVTPVWVEVRCKDREADIPSVSVTDDRCEQHLARGARVGFLRPESTCWTGRSNHRTGRVSSCTRMTPMVGNVTERGCPSPTRIEQVPFRPILFRSRKLSRQLPSASASGKPILRGGRSPEFAPAKAASARARSTAASSKTWAETSCRQASPVTCFVIVPSTATTRMRPASSLRFQALKVLIKSKRDHGIVADESVFPSAIAFANSRRHWL